MTCSWRFPIAFAVLGVLVVLTAACAGAPEQPILRQYFQASRTRDNVTLGNISTASFNPRSDGEVQSFDIVSVGPEETHALQIKQQAAALKEAQSAEAEFSKRKQAYQSENTAALERVIKADRAKQKLAGKDGQIQVEWAKWREETQQFAKKVSDARAALNSDKPIVELSISNPAANEEAPDVSQMEGELVSKDVTINADVKAPDGQVGQKTLVITLMRARMKRQTGEALDGRWLVTRIKESGGAAKTS
jgi:hypothetical protein